MQYLLKYISTSGTQAVVDPLVDTLGIKSLIVSGAEFTRDNIAQVSALVAVSSLLFGDLVAVSGNAQSDLIAVSGNLHGEIVSASGALRSELITVSGNLHGEIVSVSGTLHAEIASVSGNLQTQISTVASNLTSVSGYFETRVDNLESDFLAFEAQTQIDISSVSGQVSANYGVTKFLGEALVFETADTPLEERHSVSGGQTFVSVTGMAFAPENSIPDVVVYKNGVRMTQDRLGGSSEDFRKVSSRQIQFAYPLVNFDRVLFRLERSRANHIPADFFREYISDRIGKSIPFSGARRYQVGRDALWAFRNGRYLIHSAALGGALGRFEETSSRFVTTEQRLELADVVEIINFGPHQGQSYRFYQGGLSGSTVTVPSYSVGSKELLVWRDGLLMNPSALGPLDSQYTETSPTVVTLAAVAVPADLFAFENLDGVLWREDQSGLSGSVVTLSNSYIDPDKILVFKNGVLLYRSGVLGDPGDRFSTPSSTTIGLGAAAVPSDVFSILRFA